MSTEPVRGPLTIVTERDTADLSSGVRLRVHHLVSAATALGLSPRVVSAYAAEASSTLGAIREAPAVAGALAPRLAGPVIVCGLGGVRLVALAAALDRLCADVRFDACDSVLLRVAAAPTLGRPREVAWEVLRLALHFRLPRSVRLSYISRRDARIDALLHLGRAVEVHPPAAAPGLEDLQPVDLGHLSHVVVPADFRSPHLRRGLSMLWQATSSGSPVAVRLFGPERPSARLSPNVSYAGYAPDLASVYRGDTVVYIANVGGAGVPNKLVEAATARRPVIVHPATRGRVDLPITGWTFRSSSELAGVLRAIAAGGRPRSL